MMMNIRGLAVYDPNASNATRLRNLNFQLSLGESALEEDDGSIAENHVHVG